jgi:hypothetical protein
LRNSTKFQPLIPFLYEDAYKNPTACGTSPKHTGRLGGIKIICSLPEGQASLTQQIGIKWVEAYPCEIYSVLDLSKSTPNKKVPDFHCVAMAVALVREEVCSGNSTILYSV